MRINVGTIVRTSYNTGPYVVIDITKGCTCSSFMDSINMKNPPNSRPHYHLVCRSLDKTDRSRYYLNGYDENLNSVWNNDRLIICEEETTMLNLLLNI